MNVIYILLIIILIIVIYILTQLHKYYLGYKKTFSRTIKPNQTYKVYNRIYKLPNIPIFNQINNQKLEKIPIVSEKFSQKQRILLKKISHILNKLGVIWWPSGGTLLGFTRHGTFIPWDDDIDLHAKWKYKNLLYGKQFSNLCRQHGLQAKIILFNSVDNSSFLDATIVVEFKKKHGVTPKVDIFLVKQIDDTDRWAKVNNWSANKTIYSKLEVWKQQDLFPITYKTFDYGLILPTPANPLAVLQQQYGSSVMDKMIWDSIAHSHAGLFECDLVKTFLIDY